MAEEVAQARKVATDALEKDREILAAACEEEVLSSKASRSPEVVQHHNAFASIEKLIEEQSGATQHAHLCNRLSSAVVTLEDAVISGRDGRAALRALHETAAEADAFTCKLLAAMPKDAVTLCQRGEVPTDEMLKGSLADELSALVVAAFVPTGSGMLEEVLARFFQRLYVPDSDIVADSDVARNLAALTRARRAIRDGEGNAMLAHLESSLSGTCRDRAASSVEKYRAALLARQTLRAAKARSQCLNATLLMGT